MMHPVKVREKFAKRMFKNGRTVKEVMDLTGLSFYWCTLKSREIK